jgi:hypothetical protein
LTSRSFSAPPVGEKKKVKASETTAMLVITGRNPIVRKMVRPRRPVFSASAITRASGNSTASLTTA